MTFPRVKPLGWTDDIDTVTAAELNQIDVNLTHSIDGVGGGTYTPAGVIKIAGAGLEITQNIKTTRSLDRTLEPFVPVAETGTWVYDGAVLATNNVAGHISVPCLMPHGCELNSVTVKWKGAAGHAGLPGTMPYFTMARLGLDGGLATLLFPNSFDPSADVAAYQAIHDWSATGIGHSVDRRFYNYHFIMVSEGAPNYVAGALLLRVLLNFLVTEIPMI